MQLALEGGGKRYEMRTQIKLEPKKIYIYKHITSSVYDCTVEDVEIHNVSIVTHSHHLVVVTTLP